MKISFSIEGEPVGKARPRVVSRGGYARAYTPEKTANYEKAVKLIYNSKCKHFFAVEPLKMTIKAYYGIAKSISNKKRQLMLKGDLKPLKKPDLDNVVKIICDALNETAYHDDTQIVEIHAYKAYGEPRVEVEIEDVD